jgi:hypothetical protein
VDQDELDAEWLSADFNLNGKVTVGEICRVIYWQSQEESDSTDSDSVDAGFEDVAADESSDASDDTGLDAAADETTTSD